VSVDECLLCRRRRSSLAADVELSTDISLYSADVLRDEFLLADEVLRDVAADTKSSEYDIINVSDIRRDP